MKMIFGCALLLTTAVFFSGCTKSKPPVAQAPPPVTDTNPPAPVSRPPEFVSAPSVVIAADPKSGADLKQLNHAYVGWIIQNRRRPKNFEEYVALSGVQIPPPPAGKKYVIDQYGYINLANN
jgi:hypothetical protein